MAGLMFRRPLAAAPFSYAPCGVGLRVAVLLLLGTLPLAGVAASAELAGSVVRACVSDVPIPPFLWFTADGKASGFSSEMLERIRQRHRIATLSITPLPMPRCLALSAAGQYDLVLNVPTAQIAPQPFLISQAFFKTSAKYFYTRKHFPSGLKITNLQELLPLRVCTLQGYNLDFVGLRQHQYDPGAKNYESLFKKLAMGHCDIVVERQEVINGIVTQNAELQARLNAPLLRSGDIPDDAATYLHLAVSRRSPLAEPLLAALNRSIREMSADGSLKALFARHNH